MPMLFLRTTVSFISPMFPKAFDYANTRDYSTPFFTTGLSTQVKRPSLHIQMEGSERRVHMRAPPQRQIATNGYPYLCFVAWTMLQLNCKAHKPLHSRPETPLIRHIRIGADCLDQTRPEPTNTMLTPPPQTNPHALLARYCRSSDWSPSFCGTSPGSSPSIVRKTTVKPIRMSRLAATSHEEPLPML